MCRSDPQGMAFWLSLFFSCNFERFSDFDSSLEKRQFFVVLVPNFRQADQFSQFIKEFCIITTFEHWAFSDQSDNPEEFGSGNIREI